MALYSFNNRVNQKPSILDAIIIQGVNQTPFLQWVGKGSVNAPKHSWILDSYADAKSNSNLEITDIEEDTTDTKFMKENVVQIIKNDYSLSDEEVGNAKYGQKEWPYRTAKKGVEHAKDIEYAMLGLHNDNVFDNYTVGTRTVPAKMAGIFHYVDEANRKTLDSKGDGTGTKTKFTMDILSELIEPIWLNGGLASESFSMVVGPIIKRTINKFAGDQYFRQVKGEAKFDPTLYHLETDFGTINVKIHTLFADPKLNDKVFVGKLDEIRMMSKIATKRTDVPTSKTAKVGRYYTSFTTEMKRSNAFACASGLK